MEITLQTKIADLLEKYPILEDTLIELSPAFVKLRNLILRRTVAKVASIQQAAQIAGISPVVMVQTLRKAAGLAEGDFNEIIDENTDVQPIWFDEAKINIRYDACPIINSGQSPMQEIIRLSSTLKAEEIMELTTPFKPIPIIDLLRSKGFKAWNNNNKTYFTPK